jgi:hypothetical protein
MLNVVMDKTSPDSIPDGIVGGSNFDTSAFIFGIFVGVFATVIIMLIMKAIIANCISPTQCKEETKSNEETYQKSDE